jgi:hypothetical protein
MRIHPGIIVLNTCHDGEECDIQNAAVDYDDFQIAVLMNWVKCKKQKYYGVLVVKCHLMYFLFFTNYVS